MEELRENRDIFKIFLEIELGCINDTEFDKAFDITLEDIGRNQQVLEDMKNEHTKETTLNYILNTLSTSLDLVRREWN